MGSAISSTAAEIFLQY